MGFQGQGPHHRQAEKKAGGGSKSRLLQLSPGLPGLMSQHVGFYNVGL